MRRNKKFRLLHLFLKRRYERLDIVFIRHTHHAEEVDEETFFYSRQSGGTVVSTALEKMLEIQRERYDSSEWNIDVAQASDGYTQSGDAKRCVEGRKASWDDGRRRQVGRTADGPQPQSILKVSDGLFQPPLTVVIRRHMLAPGFLLALYDRT